MRRNRLVTAVVVGVVAAVAISVYVNNLPLPLQRFVPSVSIDSMKEISMRAVAMDGKEFTVRGRFSPESPDVMMTDVPNGYLIDWTVDVDKSVRKQLGAVRSGRAAILEMRDENHRVRWRLLYGGSISSRKCNSRGEVALILEDDIVKKEDYGKDRSRQLVYISATGELRWRQALATAEPYGYEVVTAQHMVLLQHDSNNISEISLYDEQGLKARLSPRMYGQVQYQGIYGGRHVFSSEQEEKGKEGGWPTKVSVYGIDQHGNIDHLIATNGVKLVTSTRFASIKGQMSLLIATNDGRISGMPIKGGKRTELTRVEKAILTFPETLNQTSPIIFEANYAGEGAEIEPISILSLDKSGGHPSLLKKYKAYMRHGGYRAAYIPYDKQTVLMVVPHRYGDTSRLCLVNAEGRMICDCKVNMRSYADSAVAIGQQLVVSMLDGNSTISIPMVSTPTISTTPTADGLMVRITCATKSATIRYSVNTRDPDSKGQRYRGEFTVPKGSTITARATAPRTLPSKIAEVVGK